MGVFQEISIALGCRRQQLAFADSLSTGSCIVFVPVFYWCYASAPISTESLDGNQTRVAWGMSSRMKYPMNIMLLFGIEKMLGKDMETSLTTLKNVMEKQ